MDPKELVKLIEILNPKNKPGRIIIITMMGAKNMRVKLPHLIRAVRRARKIVTWVSDPMHGNTIKAPCGLKTRLSDAIRMLILKKTTQWIQLRMVNTMVRFKKNLVSDTKRERLQLRTMNTGAKSKMLNSSFSRASSVSRRREVEETEDVSVSVSSRIHTRFTKKFNLSSRINVFKEWIGHPMNAAFLLWLICVAVFAAMLGLLFLGLLDGAFPTEISRNRWIEIDNQVLNALFTLMCLYQHPSLFHHLVLLFRWKSEDIIELRKTYSKNGAYHPGEWAHMMLVVTLQHISCFSQYASCGLYWGYSREQRPEFAENFFLAVGVTAPIIAELYTIYSPLGRKFISDTEREQQDVLSLTNKNNKTFKFPIKQI